MLTYSISMILNLHPSAQLSPSPQLTLPEDTQARFGHTFTACRMCPDQVNATSFGGCPKFVFGDYAKQKLAETTVMEFGEQNTHCTLHCIVCDLNSAMNDVCTDYTCMY